MSGRQLLCVGVLSGLIGACSGALAAVVLGAGPVSAAVGTEPQRPARWEYCAITVVGGMTGKDGGIDYAASVNYFTGTGNRHEEVPGNTPGEALAAALSKLGSDGWEMVGGDTFREVAGSEAKNTSSMGVMYFKRAR